MTTEPPASPFAPLIVLWGLGGVLLILVAALLRLTPLALYPLLSPETTGPQLLLYILWCLFNGYAEGYRGFQKAFAPRVVARAYYLSKHPHPLHVLLAPFFCMTLFHAPRRRIIISWVLVLLIYTLVRLVRDLPQPWRGIVDGGVVVGLGWGCIAILVIWGRTVFGKPPATSPQVPSSFPAAAAEADASTIL